MNKAAQALGRLGGKARSARKTAAAKANIEKRWAKHRAELVKKAASPESTPKPG